MDITVGVLLVGCRCWWFVSPSRNVACTPIFLILALQFQAIMHSNKAFVALKSMEFLLLEMSNNEACMGCVLLVENWRTHSGTLFWIMPLEWDMHCWRLPSLDRFQLCLFLILPGCGEGGSRELIGLLEHQEGIPWYRLKKGDQSIIEALIRWWITQPNAVFLLCHLFFPVWALRTPLFRYESYRYIVHLVIVSNSVGGLFSCFKGNCGYG